MEMWRGRLTTIYIRVWKNVTLVLVKENYKKLKPHSSEEIKNAVGEGERDNYDND